MKLSIRHKQASFIKPVIATLIASSALSTAAVTIVTNPNAPTTIGIKAKITTTEKDSLGGSFINHNYYPGPTDTDWVGGAQVTSLFLDNNSDGRGDFRAIVNYGNNGQVTVKGIAKVANGVLAAGWVDFLVAQKFTNTTASTITRTFSTSLHASIVQNNLETFAETSVYAFSDAASSSGAQFRLDDPFTMDVVDGIPLLAPTENILLGSAGANQLETVQQTVTLNAGQSVYMIAELRFQADEAGAYVDGLNTFNISVDDPSGLSFGAVPEPSTTSLIGLAGFMLILRRRK